MEIKLFLSLSKISSKNQFLLQSDLKGQSSEILIDRPWPEYEPLLIFQLFGGPHDLKSKKIFFTRFRRNPFGKIIFFRKFL
jgi:hypothetical protein